MNGCLWPTLSRSRSVPRKKQFIASGNVSAGVSWEFDVTDTLGIVNVFFTASTGQVQVCALEPGAHTVAEDINASAVELIVNGVFVAPSTISSFTWASGQIAPIILSRTT